MPFEKRRLIIALGLISGASLVSYLFASQVVFKMGFPLDDAWIHQTYARNLALHGEWSFIPGQPSAGSTAPGWSLLLAAGYLLRLSPLGWSFLLGWTVLWSVALIGALGFAHQQPVKMSWLLGIGALFAVEWHLVWAAASGMETLLAGGIALLVVVWLTDLVSKQIDDRRIAWQWLGVGALVGLSCWIRPDGISLLLAVGITWLFARGKLSDRLRIAISSVVGFLLLFLPYLGFNQALAGQWWPNTFFAKQAEYASLLALPLWERLLGEFKLPLVGVGVLLLPGFIWCFVKGLQSKQGGYLGGAAWVTIYLALYAFRLPVTYQHGRYAMPVLPVYLWLGLVGTRELYLALAEKPWRRVISQVWLVSTILVSAIFYVLGAVSYAKDVAIIESEMVHTAKWIALNTKADDLIAAHDIGALGYFGDRHLLDLAGLISPDVIPFIRDQESLSEYLSDQGADYLVTFPGWYPDLVLQTQPIYSTNASYSPAEGGENMTVYRWPIP